MRRILLLLVVIAGFTGLAQAATKCEQANSKLLDAQTSAKAKYESLVAKRDAVVRKYEGNLELAKKAGKIPPEPVEKTDFSELERRTETVCDTEKIKLVEEWIQKTTQLAAVLCGIDDVQGPCDDLRRLVAGIAEEMNIRKKSD